MATLAEFAKKYLQVLSVETPEEKRNVILQLCGKYTDEADLLFILTDRSLPAFFITTLRNWAKVHRDKSNSDQTK